MSSALRSAARVLGRRRIVWNGLRRPYTTKPDGTWQRRGIYGAGALLGIGTLAFATRGRMVHADEAARDVTPTGAHNISDQRVPKISPDGDQSLQMEAEGESEEEGAYNPETGEIHWDCPCLGGMAHGPCGDEFRQAFSCFVHSDADPKGIECIDRFKLMQDCFRKHPDVYAGELAEDASEEEAEEALASAGNGAAEGGISSTVNGR